MSHFRTSNNRQDDCDAIQNTDHKEELVNKRGPLYGPSNERLGCQIIRMVTSIRFSVAGWMTCFKKVLQNYYHHWTEVGLEVGHEVGPEVLRLLLDT